MNFFKKIKIKEISTSNAIIFTGILISASIFLTGYIFLGDSNTRPKNLSATPPNLPVKNTQPPNMQRIQDQQRMIDLQKARQGTTSVPVNSN